MQFWVITQVIIERIQKETSREIPRRTSKGIQERSAVEMSEATL